MQVTITDSVDQLLSLEADWEALYTSSENANIFLSFDWISTWLKHYQFMVKRLYVICVWENSRLIAVLPLYQQQNLFSFQLWFVGTGEPEACEVCSEYQDILCAKGQQGNVLKSLTTLFSEQTGLPGLRLPNVRESALIKRFVSQLNGMFIGDIDVTGMRFFMSIKAGLADTKLTKKTRRFANVWSRLPNTSVVEPSSEQQVSDSFDDLVTLHNIRWRQKLNQTIFDNPCFNAFHREIMVRLYQRGRLSMMIMKVDQRKVAASYCMHSGNDLVYYQSGHDDNFRPNISAGLLSHLFQAEKALKHGSSSYDLLASKSAENYKSKLVESTEKIYSISVFRSPLIKFLSQVTEPLVRIYKRISANS